MNELDVSCEVCQAPKGVPCHNPCTGELRESGACIGRVVRRAAPPEELRKQNQEER